MDKKAQWAPFALRLIIGYGFMAHGWAKISRGTAGFEKLPAFGGVPLSHLSGTIGPYIELLCGLAILLGAYVAITAIPWLEILLPELQFNRLVSRGTFHGSDGSLP